MRESPRRRRLRSDLRMLQQLRNESNILDFVAQADEPEAYTVRLHGKGFWRPDGSKEVLIREHHEFFFGLSASYPRTPPELAWRTPIFHPNISAGGVVCLGGYGTHWVPSVGLGELCVMLWDMVRFQNFDVESPYNREAAGWVKHQSRYVLPIDPRPLRDKLAGVAPLDRRKPPIHAAPPSFVPDEMTFIESAIVEAEIVSSADPDILYIE